MEHPVNQSARRRAWEDTKHSFHTIKFFVGVEVVSIGGFIFLATLQIPENASGFVSAVYPAVGTIIGALVGFGIIYLIMLVKAPYRQRNEARATLLEKPKPMSNKDALLRAISYFTESAIVETSHLEVMAEHSCKFCPLMEPSDFTQAYKTLSAEKLVAGEEADKIVSPFMVFILKQMVAQIDDEPSAVKVLSREDFIDKLGKMKRKMLKKIEALTR